MPTTRLFCQSGALLWLTLVVGLTGCGQPSRGVEPTSEADPGDVAGDPGPAADQGVGDTSAAADDQPGDEGLPWQMPTLPTCNGSYAAPISVVVNAPPALVEASGIVASPQNPDVLWVHSDSGSASILYALDVNGQLLGTLELPADTLVDAEDIAAGPCPNLPHTPCLWVADTGDNSLSRTDAAVWAVPEPKVNGALPFGSLSAAAAWRFPITYDIGPTDVEALVVLPDASALYLFEKVDSATARMLVVMAPFSENQPAVAGTVATLVSPGVPIAKGRMITAADLHPSGTRLLLRVYTGIFEYRLDGRPLTDIHLVTPSVVAWGPLSEPQGEAVAYAGSGVDIWSISEDPDLATVQPLHRYACQ
jgi:hypothetical protein